MNPPRAWLLVGKLMLMYQKVFNAFYYFFKVDSIAVQLLNEKVKTATVPDVNGDADTPAGHVSYSLSRCITH